MKYKILVVDDDQNIAELIRIYLEKEMFCVKIAYDGKKHWIHSTNGLRIW